MKTKLFFVGLFLMSLFSFGQKKTEKKEKVYTDPIEFLKTLEDGSYAANFTLQDLNGNTYTLYDYLDQGKTVFIDFFAVWCGPCWNFMNSHALEDLYKAHGPAGAPGVDTNTTDDVMAFAIEVSGNNANLACLQGDDNNCSHPYGTQGDWITAAGDLPLLPTYSPNTNQCASDYEITAVPTIYKICPNREVKEVGQLSSGEAYYSTVSQCPPPPSSSDDAVLWSVDYPGVFPYCVSNFSPEIKIQNYGTSDLTSLTIKTYVDNNEVSSYDWSGNLATYELTSVTLPEFNVTPGTHTLKIKLLNPNGNTDANPNDNEKEINFTSNSNGYQITLNLLTDNYPDETSWDLKHNGQVIASGDGYSYPKHHYLIDMCLAEGECYDFTIHDAYGDGMTNNGVTGHVTITGENGDTLVDFRGDEFTTSKTVNFCLNSAGVNDFVMNNVKIFPNPARDFITIKNASNSDIQIITESGKIILSKNITTNEARVNISSIKSGYYVLKVITKEGIIVSHLIINR